MTYALYYWPTIQGRGEFVRLALEEAGAEYTDVGRRHGGRDFAAVAAILDDAAASYPPFAPPVLESDGRLIAQTANILLFLGPRLGLSASSEASCLWINQLQLTLADWVAEIHDTHHPLGPSLHFEEQKAEAARRAAMFREERLPKYLGYFEGVLRARAGDGPYLMGAEPSYADLSLFQVVDGLRYAFPRAMAAAEPNSPQVSAVHKAVAERPRIAAYLASERRIPFNEDGIFRCYRDLDD